MRQPEPRQTESQRLWVNGADAQVPFVRPTVHQVLRHLGYAPEGVAVAVGGRFVPRASWGERILDAGERLDIVGAAQGG